MSEKFIIAIVLILSVAGMLYFVLKDAYIPLEFDKENMKIIKIDSNGNGKIVSKDGDGNNKNKKINIANNYSAGIPELSWFPSISAPVFKTEEDIQKEWQARERCCIGKKELVNNNRIFYKACYNYIYSKYAEDEGIVKCLWLMGGSESQEVRRQLKKYLYDNYFYHVRRTDNCFNCAGGDTIVRATQDLAYIYGSNGNENKAVELLENVLDKRKDVSPWVRLEATKVLARYYNKENFTEQRKAFLLDTLNYFSSIKDSDEPVSRRYPQFETYIKTVLTKLEN